jgi:hypothetical protein
MFEQVLKSMFRGNFTKSASQKRDPAKGCSFVPAISENVAFGVRKEMAGHEPNTQHQDRRRAITSACHILLSICSVFFLCL